ncbi:MAG: hypothetical protein ACJAR0_003680 [Candidatus Azotimanducaceae bacterium]|jgi:hypothetical protein
MVKRYLGWTIWLAIFFSSVLQAADVSWVGASDNEWSRSENWDIGVPQSDDEAQLEGHARTTLSTSEVIDGFSLGSNAELTITATGQLTTLHSMHGESTLSGVLKNSGFFSGKIYGGGIVENSGTINVDQYLHIATLLNAGEITGDDIQRAAIVNSGTIHVDELYSVDSVANSGDIRVNDLVGGFVNNTGSIDSSSFRVGTVTNTGFISGWSFDSGDLINDGVIEVNSLFAGHVVNRGTLDVLLGSFAASLVENDGVIIANSLDGTIINRGTLNVRQGVLVGENYATIVVDQGGSLDIDIVNAGLIINNKSGSNDLYIREALNNDLGVIQYGEVTNAVAGNTVGGVFKDLSGLDGGRGLELTGSFLDGRYVRGDVTFSGIVQGGFELDGYGYDDTIVTFVESTVFKSQFGRDSISADHSQTRITLGGTLEFLFDELVKEIEEGDLFDMILSKNEILGDFSKILYTGLEGIDLVGNKLFEGGTWLYRVEAVAAVPEPNTFLMLFLGLQFLIYHSSFVTRKPLL